MAGLLRPRGHAAPRPLPLRGHRQPRARRGQRSQFPAIFGGDRTQVKGKLYGSMRWGRARFFFLNGEASFDGDDRELARGRAHARRHGGEPEVALHRRPQRALRVGQCTATTRSCTTRTSRRCSCGITSISSSRGTTTSTSAASKAGFATWSAAAEARRSTPFATSTPAPARSSRRTIVIALDVGKDAVTLVAKRIDGTIHREGRLHEGQTAGTTTLRSCSKPVFPHAQRGHGAAPRPRAGRSAPATSSAYPSSSAPLFLAPLALLLPWLRRRR